MPVLRGRVKNPLENSKRMLFQGFERRGLISLYLSTNFCQDPGFPEVGSYRNMYLEVRKAQGCSNAAVFGSLWMT
jgi:hypothetical protein